MILGNHIVRRLTATFALLICVPALAAAQRRARPTIEFRVLGAYARPALSSLEESFAGHRRAETAGAPIGSDESFHRSVARSVTDDSEFDGFGGAVEIGATLPLGADAERRVGLALQLGYDRVGADYTADFGDASRGTRDEILRLARAAVLPRYTFGAAGLTASVGGSAGLLRARYQSAAITEVAGPSSVSHQSALFSGEETTWTAGLFGEIRHSFTSRAGLLARLGYDYVPVFEIPVTGSDIDAGYRDRNTRPYSPVLAFPEADGTMGERPVPIELSGFRIQLGIEYQFSR